MAVGSRLRISSGTVLSDRRANLVDVIQARGLTKTYHRKKEVVEAVKGIDVDVAEGELHLLVGLLILGVFGIGLGALSYALGLASKGREWVFWTVQQTLLFPSLILSGMMLPLEAGPGWMRVAARFNPLTYIVEAERALLAGSLADSAVLWGAVAAIITAVVGVAVGIRKVRTTI